MGHELKNKVGRESTKKKKIVGEGEVAVVFCFVGGFGVINGLVEEREASFPHSSMAPLVIIIVVVVIDRSRVHVHMPISYRASKGTPIAPQQVKSS